jgi:3'-5' exoribonuclease
MAVLRIPDLAAGDRVQHELMVRAREDKQTRTGDPYVVLKLANTTGEIAANIWSEQVRSVEGVVPGNIVQVIGTVEDYKGRRQLKLTAPLRVVATQAADLDAFLPSVAVDLRALWARVDAWRNELGTNLRQAADLFFADDAFRAEFERTPGAPRGHHARLGGLLLHVVEVGEIARHAASTMSGHVGLVTVGALLHDIGKVKAYTIGPAGFDHSPAGRLLGHIVLGSLMLEGRLATLAPAALGADHRLELHHFIQSHHGVPEFGAAVRPMTLEAELLHFADQSSAKGNDFTDAVDDPELFPGDEAFSSKKSWRLERRVWRRPHSWD